MFLSIQVGSTPLYQASFMGNSDEVKELLEGGTDVNERNDVSTKVLLLNPKHNTVTWFLDSLAFYM